MNLKIKFSPTIFSNEVQVQIIDIIIVSAPIYIIKFITNNYPPR